MSDKLFATPWVPTRLVLGFAWYLTVLPVCYGCVVHTRVMLFATRNGISWYRVSIYVAYRSESFVW